MSVRSWLPENAITLDAVEAALGSLIAEWSKKWFMRKRATIAALRCHEVAANPGIQLLSECAALQMASRCKRLLLEAVLNLDLGEQVLLDADRRALDELVSHVLSDLMASLDKRFLGESRFSDERGLVLSIALGAGELLTLTLPEHVLVAAIKATLLPAERKERALGKRLQALLATQLTTQAVLGRADLAIGELEKMELGDVIVLDRTLEDPIELVHAGTLLARGKLKRTGAGLSLQL